jgi:hypothetical protein
VSGLLDNCIKLLKAAQVELSWVLLLLATASSCKHAVVDRTSLLLLGAALPSAPAAPLLEDVTDAYLAF